MSQEAVALPVKAAQTTTSINFGDQLEHARELAEAQQRSLSGLIRWLVAEAWSAADGGQAAPAPLRVVSEAPTNGEPNDWWRNLEAVGWCGAEGDDIARRYCGRLVYPAHGGTCCPEGHGGAPVFDYPLNTPPRPPTR